MRLTLKLEDDPSYKEFLEAQHKITPTQTLIHLLSWKVEWEDGDIVCVHLITIINPSPDTLFDQIQKGINFGHRKN